jgi:hypothetical protein
MSKTDPQYQINPHSKYTVKRCVVCKKDTFYSDRISKVFKNDFECLCKNCNSERQAQYAMKKLRVEHDQVDGYADFGVSSKLLVTVSYFVGRRLLSRSYIISGNGSYYIDYDDVWNVITASFSTNSFEMSRLTDYEYTRMEGYVPELVMGKRLAHHKLCQSLVDVTKKTCDGISTIFVNEA